MKCNSCKYYHEGSTDYDYYNECELTGDMYFIPFCDKDCPYIEDNYKRKGYAR